MTGNDNRLNARIDGLESVLSTKTQQVKSDMEGRIEAVKEDINQRLQESEQAARRSETVKNSESNFNGRLIQLQALNESRLDRLERFSLDKDLVILGVPESHDDPDAIIGEICGALNCDLRPGDFVTAFRLRGGTPVAKNNRSPPIVARLQDDWVKQNFLTAYFRKKNLNLEDIGFKFPARIYINERLTSTNRAIFNRAAQAKKLSYIFRFYTRKGLVYVQRDANSRPLCIENLAGLDKFFPDQCHTDASTLRPPPDMSKTNHNQNQPAVPKPGGPTIALLERESHH